MGGRTGRRRDGAEEVVLALVHSHAGELLRFARRFSLCADDAQDAYQRALEILVRRLRTQSLDNPLSYLRTIIRHEAYQVRVERERDLHRQEVDFEAAGTEPEDDPLERAERFERLAHTAEALQRLKPQELTALTLRAEGLSYREICDREGWTYTRCNRAISEGRRALLERLGAIESGAECDRWLPLLSAFADGEAAAREVVELRPHLRACTACRATLRELHDTTRGIRSVVPPELLLPVALASGSGSGLGRHAEALVHGAVDRAASPSHGPLERLSAAVHGTLDRVAAPSHGPLERISAAVHGVVDRVTAPAVRMQSAVEALSGAKVAAVAASTVAVAGGGVAIERAATEPAGSRPPARVERVTATSPPSASLQPASLPTTSTAIPAALSPATVLAATPEWPSGGERRDGVQARLDEFGFEGPISRPAAGAAARGAATAAAGTSAAASGAARPRRRNSTAAPHGSAAATGRSGTAASPPNPADPPTTQPASPSPAPSDPPPAPRVAPEFPGGEF